MDISTCQDLGFIDERQAVEDKYFKDIICCGQSIATLHKLIEHHELFHDLADFRESDEEEGNSTKTMRYQDVFLPVFNHTTFIRPMVKIPTSQNYSNPQERPTIDTDLLLRPIEAKKTPCSDLWPVFDFVQKSPNARPVFDFVQKAPDTRPIFDFVQKTPYTQPVITCVKKVCNEQGPETEKRYICRELDCNKAYKNLNGLRYHQIHGHQNGQEIPRPHVCDFCGKSYKASNGLRYHIEHVHA